VAYSMLVPPEADTMPAVADPGFWEALGGTLVKGIDSAIDVWRANSFPETFAKPQLNPLPQTQAQMARSAFPTWLLWVIGGGVVFLVLRKGSR